MYNTRCMEMRDVQMLSDRTSKHTEIKILPLDIKNLQHQKILEIEQFQFASVNEDFLKEQLEMEADEGELNFRGYLFDIIYDIRTWIAEKEGLEEIAKAIVSYYRVSLIDNEDFYTWCTTCRDDDYRYLTDLLVRCIDVSADFNIGKKLGTMINDHFKEMNGVGFPILKQGNFRKSLRDYCDGRVYAIKNHNFHSMPELRKIKEKLYDQRLEDNFNEKTS